jgi:hypothetical protein
MSRAISAALDARAADPSDDMITLFCESDAGDSFQASVHETELLLRDLERRSLDPSWFCVNGLSRLVGVLWNGFTDRRRRLPESAVRIPITVFRSRIERPAVSLESLRRRLSFDRALCEVLSPFRPMLPTAAKRIWGDICLVDAESLVHPDVAALELLPSVRQSLEMCISLLADTVKPMADDLGMSNDMLMSVDELVKIEYYRAKVSTARFTPRDFFPVPIIVWADDSEAKKPEHSLPVPAEGPEPNDARGMRD